MKNTKKRREKVKRLIEKNKRKKASLRRLKEKSKCERCGTKNNLTIDHVRKKEHSGSDDRSNLRILCWSCHKKRHKKETPTIHYYLGNKRYTLPR